MGVPFVTEPSPTELAWERFTGALAECLTDLVEDEFLVISNKTINYYIQFAGQGRFGMRAEASCNQYIEPPEAWLDQDDYRAMASLGWHRATSPRHEKMQGKPDPDGSPNFFMDVDYPVDSGKVAQLTVQTFRTVFRIGHAGNLQYKAFSRSGDKIRFPCLHIKREGT
jgi:hypothetical protein